MASKEGGKLLSNMAKPSAASMPNKTPNTRFSSNGLTYKTNTKSNTQGTGKHEPSPRY